MSTDSGDLAEEQWKSFQFNLDRGRQGEAERGTWRQREKQRIRKRQRVEQEIAPLLDS